MIEFEYDGHAGLAGHRIGEYLDAAGIDMDLQRHRSGAADEKRVEERADAVRR